MAPLLGGIFLVGVSMAHTMYRAFRYTPPSFPKAKEEHKNAPASRPTLDHYAVIFQRDLFTSALSGIEERVETNHNKIGTSTVPFKLKGTVVVSSGISAAIIENPANKKQELFHENEMVQGFKIVKIMRNKVIVDKDGYEEVVEVVEEREKTVTKPLQRPRAIKRRPVQRPTKVMPPKKKFSGP